MSAPSDTPSSQPTSPTGQTDTSIPIDSRSAGSVVPVGLAIAGAVLTGLSPLLGLVEPAAPPAYPSWPLLLLFAAVAPALAAIVLRRRPLMAMAVLAGAAALVPGRMLVDAQLLVDPGLAARPELLLATTLDPLTPATGAWILFAGHLLTLLAGVIALARGTGHGGADTAGGQRGQGLLALVLCATVLIAVGALMAPLVSRDPYLLSRGAVDAPVVVLLGSVLIALAVPCAGGLAASASTSEVARGGLLGLAAGTLTVAGPPLISALAMSTVDVASGPVLALVGAGLLGWLARTVGPDGVTGAGEGEVADLRLPAMARLLQVSGVLAVLAGLLAVLGAFTPQLHMPPGFDEVAPHAARGLLPAGVLLMLLGGAVLVPRAGATVRPVLLVSTAIVPMAAAGALDSVFSALQVTGASSGFGAWAAGAAVLAAAGAAVCLALAGGVERDDVDLSETEVRRPVVLPASVAAVLAVLTFALPVVVAPGYVQPGLVTDFRITSWGLLVALLAVLVATGLAPMSRPLPAAGLLGGAALVTLVRMLDLAVSAGRVSDPAPGPGVWFGAACIVALIVAVVVAMRTSQTEYVR